MGITIARDSDQAKRISKISEKVLRRFWIRAGKGDPLATETEPLGHKGLARLLEIIAKHVKLPDEAVITLPGFSVRIMREVFELDPGGPLHFLGFNGAFCAYVANMNGSHKTQAILEEERQAAFDRMQREKEAAIFIVRAYHRKFQRKKLMELIKLSVSIVEADRKAGELAEKIEQSKQTMKDLRSTKYATEEDRQAAAGALLQNAWKARQNRIVLGPLVRMQVQRKREVQKRLREHERQKSASMIQRFFKGYLARQHVVQQFGWMTNEAKQKIREAEEERLRELERQERQARLEREEELRRIQAEQEENARLAFEAREREKREAVARLNGMFRSAARLQAILRHQRSCRWEREKVAAILIQSWIRGHLARREVEEIRRVAEMTRKAQEMEARVRKLNAKFKAAATMVHVLGDRRKSRRIYNEKLRKLAEEEERRTAEEQSALVIQSLFRAQVAKKAVKKMRAKLKPLHVIQAEQAERDRLERIERRKQLEREAEEERQRQLEYERSLMIGGLEHAQNKAILAAIRSSRMLRTSVLATSQSILQEVCDMKDAAIEMGELEVSLEERANRLIEESRGQDTMRSTSRSGGRSQRHADDGEQSTMWTGQRQVMQMPRPYSARGGS